MIFLLMKKRLEKYQSADVDSGFRLYSPPPLPEERKRDRQIDTYTERNRDRGEGGGGGKRKGRGGGNSNDLLGTKGLEKLQKSML